MKFKPFFYKSLLHLLRGVLLVKRSLAVVLRIVWRYLVSLDEAYKRTLGFRIFKILFLFHKRFGKHPLGTARGIREWVGQRRGLEAVILALLVLFSLPHSRLFAEDYTELPGRKTLLYSVLGPGDQNFSLVEEVFPAAMAASPTAAGEAWREGAVGVQLGQAQPGGANQAAVQFDEFGGLAFGGSAVTKPIIIPGGLAVRPGMATPGRTAIALYEVKPGDVIGNIARSFGISVETILWANNLTARSLIRPGDILKVLPVDGVTHKVVRGDTILKLAKTYGAKAEDIVSFNNLKEDGTNIVVGGELIIPHGRRAASTRAIAGQGQSPARSNPLGKIVPPPSLSIPAGAGYVWPTAATIITQYFGWRHTGLDIAGKIGTPVYAARAGEVVKSQCGWNGGYGCYVIIEHADGLRTLYAHNSQLYVSPGESVSQGQVISLMGSTGRSTGPHVHFEVRIGGRFANPLQYVRR